jgi:petrobactin synthase
VTRSDVIDAIRQVLSGPMQHRRMEDFSATARLNEDLYLDSILILQVFLNLELEHGLMADDAVISAKNIVTVGDLADLFVEGEEAALPEPAAAAEPMLEYEGGVHGEEYFDVKVHCFVSCLCDGLKRRGIDHRPFYFGIWDAPFGLGPRHELLYHDASVSHEPFRLWFEQLFRAPVTPWYDHGRSKHENIATFLDLLRKRSETEGIMVMLDLFHLPERENKFNQNPFPHYLMPEMTEDPDVFFVRDPDFRWEGPIARDLVLNAIAQPTVAGGYRFDSADFLPAEDIDVANYLDTCLIRDRNPLIDALRAILAAHADGHDGLALEDLTSGLRELPVLAIRKYAYEHGFAFIWRAARLPNSEFEHWCVEIEALHQELKNIHFAAMKLAQTGDRRLIEDVSRRIDRADTLEFSIKAGLATAFDAWREGLPKASETPRKLARA